MPANGSKQALYTREQINEYFDYISFPVTKYNITPESARTEHGLTHLSALQRYQLSAVPFENLELHYSKERHISLDKEDLFTKIVGSKNGRGGYCMENNTFFGTVLKTLGFEVVATGARVLLSGGSGGWSHSVNLVHIDGQTYLVDVGFGGNGPTRPLPLVHGKSSKWGSTETELRLVYREPSNPVVQGIWTFESRITSQHDWAPNYCFGLTEFLPQDFEVMNYATSTRRTSWFTFDIICLKMILDNDKDEIIGVLILSGSTLKRRIFGNTEVIAECANEYHRIALLKDYFGISLSSRASDGIRGLVTELKDGSKSGL